jgi:hypothetical protein
MCGSPYDDVLCARLVVIVGILPSPPYGSWWVLVALDDGYFHLLKDEMLFDV